MDVSFISLHPYFPVAQAITTPDAMGVCLVKPQFEADAKRLARMVWCATLLPREVLHNAMGYAAANGFAVRGLDFSPVKGPEGNIEYLMFVQKSGEPSVLDDSVAEQVVAASHSTLDRWWPAIRPEKGASRMTIYISPNPGKTSITRSLRAAQIHNEPWCSCSDV